MAYVDVRASQAALYTSAVTDISGQAVIVHANADDLKSSRPVIRELASRAA